MIEEDFRFWPPGEDPDRADDYESAYNDLRITRTAEAKTQPSLPPAGLRSKAHPPSLPLAGEVHVKLLGSA